VRLWPRSLAGRLAALLILTLVVAQIVTFALFSGERIATFVSAYREDVFFRIVALVDLLEETPQELHERLATTTSAGDLRVTLAPRPAFDPRREHDVELRQRLAAALGKPTEDVRIGAARTRPPWRRWREAREDDDNDDDGWWGHHRRPSITVGASIRLSDGAWLNIAAERPPVPPLGHAFLASFLISAAAVGLVGALGVTWASAPLKRLAGAADRLGRGESFTPLPETGPQETRRANVAFNRMRERLDRYVRDRTAMLAAIAHDLRTPITSLRLRAEFIEDEETKEKILETLAEMQAMAEAVLAFTRGDAESEATRPTDVTALVESLVEDAAEGGREVRFEDSPPVTMMCRPMALKRAVGNLLDNASFYGTRARGRVERVFDEVRIVIDDDGPGIAEAELERVFDPFVRLEGSRSRETGGAGLGLAIARSIARAHGGDVKLRNREGGGLSAVLSLPV
jgi:signal transduction histidine kinase